MQRPRHLAVDRRKAVCVPTLTSLNEARAKHAFEKEKTTPPQTGHLRPSSHRRPQRRIGPRTAGSGLHVAGSAGSATTVPAQTRRAPATQPVSHYRTEVATMVTTLVARVEREPMGKRPRRRWASRPPPASTDGVEGREMNYLLATNSYHAWRRFITNLDRLSMPEPEPDRRDYLLQLDERRRPPGLTRFPLKPLTRRLSKPEPDQSDYLPQLDEGRKPQGL